MSDGSIIALVILSIGVLLIIIGIIGVYRSKTTVETDKTENLESSPPRVTQSKGGSSNTIIEQMQSDEELQRKIREGDN